MTGKSGDVAEAARLWVIRAQDATFADWDGLMVWLEQDPAHLAAYDAAVEDDAAIAAVFTTPQPHPVLAVAPPAAPGRRPFRGLVAAGVALVIAGIGTWMTIDREAPLREIATAPGEHRTIDLADGSRVQLNGGTRIRFDPERPREIALAEGEALFRVRHNETAPFVVTAGDTRLLDAGTVFNVVQDGPALQVGVAEGAVIYQPGPQAVRLAPGDTLSRARPGAVPVIRKARAQAIGSWQGGHLEYADAPLDAIARDLARNLGQPIDAAPGLGAQRFSGVIAIDGGADAVLARVAPLLGVRFVARQGGWIMSPEKSAPH